MTQGIQDEKLKAFPVSWVTTGRHVLLIGGGAVGENRMQSALDFDWSKITVVAEDATDNMKTWAEEDDRVDLHQRPVMEEDIKDAHLVIESSEPGADDETATKIANWCRWHRVPINAMDKMKLCDVHYPAFLRRGPMVIAISSGGEAPALSSRLRKWLQEKMGCGWCHAGWALAEARNKLPRGKERMDLLKGLSGDPRLLTYIEEDNIYGLKAWIEDETERVRTGHTGTD